MALTPEAGRRKWERNFPAWLEKCKEKHEGKYAYPSNERVSVGGRWKVAIVCPIHGEFQMSPEKHAFGQGCPKCSGKGTDKVAEVKALYPNFPWPANLAVEHTKSLFQLECPEHGQFVTTLNRLQTRHAQGIQSPCPKCNRIAGGAMRRKSVAKWVSEIDAVYDGKLVLDPVSVTGAGEKARFVCSEHGEFWSVLADVKDGHGCFECGRLRRNAEACLKPDDFLARARAVHGDTYEYDLSTVVSSKTPMRITCKKHGDFMQRPGNHMANGSGCPACANGTSSGEIEIAEWLASEGVEVVRRDRKRLGGKEIDIYLPQFKVGIEYCGLYWHGEHALGPTYHKDKLALARAAGIRLVTVFEDEWLNTPNKVMFRILTLLGASRVTMGRKTECRKIAWREASDFLTAQHMQGAGTPAKACYGLFDDDQLVMVSTWGLSRFSKSSEWELLRLAGSNSDRVVGGLGKMLAAFKRDHDPDSIVTYADLRWGDGEAYGKVGFSRDGETNPGYFWCKKSDRFSRYDFQKHKLKNVLKEFDETLSETENCHMNGYWRIFDCGHSRWVWKKAVTV